MRGSTVTVAQVVQLFTEECFKCGVVFGITSYFKGERQRDHGSFYCPNGHCQAYMAENEAERNARLLREEQARHQRALARLNEAEVAKAKAERKLKRVERGVCPSCNRTFANLARHMACKHADAPK
jgi:hypothetical protein